MTKQTLSQGRPTSIQDAINRLNRVRNSYDNLSGFFSGENEGQSDTKEPKTKGGFVPGGF